jgi:hypothetical protein
MKSMKSHGRSDGIAMKYRMVHTSRERQLKRDTANEEEPRKPTKGPVLVMAKSTIRSKVWGTVRWFAVHSYI